MPAAIYASSMSTSARLDPQNDLHPSLPVGGGPSTTSSVIIAQSGDCSDCMRRDRDIRKLMPEAVPAFLGSDLQDQLQTNHASSLQQKRPPSNVLRLSLRLRQMESLCLP